MNTGSKYKWKFLIFPIVALAFVLAAGFVVMSLWNAILPQVIPAVRALTYHQAVGLLILCRLLFGGFKGRGGYGGGHRGGPPWKRKMIGMSEEEREKFKNAWEERCRGRKEI